jgi:hypothetical protein
VIKTFYLSEFTEVTSVTPWVTSPGLSLVNQPAVTVTNQSFTYTLLGRSVVTFTWYVNPAPPNIAPSIEPVADFATNAGAILAIPKVAADGDIPAQTAPDSGRGFVHWSLGRR